MVYFHIEERKIPRHRSKFSSRKRRDSSLSQSFSGTRISEQYATIWFSMAMPFESMLSGGSGAFVDDITSKCVRKDDLLMLLLLFSLVFSL